MANPKIEIEHVDKYYWKTGTTSKRLGRRGRMHGTVQALRDASLTVAEGEFVSLIGPSGCGKTTLLKVLDGLVPYDSGQVRVSGKPVTGPGRDRAFVFLAIRALPVANRDGKRDAPPGGRRQVQV